MISTKLSRPEVQNFSLSKNITSKNNSVASSANNSKVIINKVHVCFASLLFFETFDMIFIKILEKIANVCAKHE